MAVLEEYLKRKVLTNLEANAVKKLSLLFYIEDSAAGKLGKKMSFKEALVDSYTLDDITQGGNSNKKGRSLHLLYQIVFEDETVFPEILKNLPNSGFISAKAVPKLTRKVRKAKYGKNQQVNGYKNEKSVFSLFNNSRFDNTLFANLNHPTDTINGDRFQGFDSNNFLGSKKDSVSFARVHSNMHSQKQNSNNFIFQDFQNIGKLLNSSELDIKRVDSSKIKNIKKEEESKQEVLYDESSNGNGMGSLQLDEDKGIKEAPSGAKNSKFDDGVATLYEKIKIFN